jgi:hypothetical protein
MMGKKGNEFSVRIIDSCLTVSVEDILTARLNDSPTVLGGGTLSCPQRRMPERLQFVV